MLILLTSCILGASAFQEPQPCKRRPEPVSVWVRGLGEGSARPGGGRFNMETPYPGTLE